MRPILIALAFASCLIFGTSLFVYLGRASHDQDFRRESLVGESYREFVSPAGFVNTDGKEIVLGDVIGAKAVLLEFMRYDCPNCQKSFPYLRTWDAAYRGEGLVIIGIHTPQFAYERELQAVRDALNSAGITFPIVLDNEYGTWNAYGNRYWPRTLLINEAGTIVYDHIGTGNYDGIEKAIVELVLD
jgi:thiol-disulfide isomerase/thioredoxin